MKKIKQIKNILGVLIIIIIILYTISFISGYFGERVSLYISSKANFYGNSLVEETIRKSIDQTSSIDSLIKYNEDDKGDIKSIAINTYQVNLILADINKAIKEKINDINIKENTTFNLPLSIIISDTIFVNDKINVKVKIIPVASSTSDIITTIEEYGINNCLFTLNVKVTLKMETIVPLIREDVTVTTNIPLVTCVINGRIPTYYYYNTDNENLPDPVDIN